jgi:hypothetical protein
LHTDNPSASLASFKEFDVICIWQAIEHIPSFWTLLQIAADKLTFNGVLVVSTPNPQSLQARWLGRYWPHLDTPRHLYLIPQLWFQSFAEKHQLAITVATTRDLGSIGLNYYGWYLAVRNALGNVLSARRVAMLAQGITSCCRRWEESEGGGCAYTVILRK